jgi:hypothetical protein
MHSRRINNGKYAYTTHNDGNFKNLGFKVGFVRYGWSMEGVIVLFWRGEKAISVKIVCLLLFVVCFPKIVLKVPDHNNITRQGPKDLKRHTQK